MRNEARNESFIRSLSSAAITTLSCYAKPDWSKDRGEQMKRFFSTTTLVALMLAITSAAAAQTATKTADDNRRVTRVTVSGDSIVQAQPDTAVVTVSVVTQ